jgi:hypothetical protein
MGASVAGLASPISPLSRSTQMAVGWGWTAFGMARVIQADIAQQAQLQQKLIANVSHEAGQVSGAVRGGAAGLPEGSITVTGGTKADQEFAAALGEEILASDRGQEMLAIARDSGYSTDLKIELNGMETNGFDGRTGIISLDLRTRAEYLSFDGWRFFSPQRILAHEVGHALTRVDDGFLGPGPNVWDNENGVMRQIAPHEPDRICYICVR